MTDWDRTAHLEAALENAVSDEARFHIRAALQHHAAERGELEGACCD